MNAVRYVHVHKKCDKCGGCVTECEGEDELRAFTRGILLILMGLLLWFAFTYLVT